METVKIFDLKATGERIAYFSKKKEINVRKIADFMGFVNTQAVYKWMRGESAPTIDNLVLLSQLFKVPMDDIICSRELMITRNEYIA